MKNNALTLFNLVLSISPTTTLSNVVGIIPTLISSKPESKIAANSLALTISSPIKNTVLSKSFITFSYVWAYSLAIERLLFSLKYLSMAANLPSILSLTTNS